MDKRATRVPTTSLDNWDFNQKHVQQNLVGSDFVGSHSVIICATAPRMEDLCDSGFSAITTLDANPESATDDLGSTIAIPIGVIDSSAIQQDRQLAQIFEIGSKRSYLMSARTASSMSLNRVIYKGPNLLRMFYSYYPAEAATSVISQDYGNILRDNTKDESTTHGDKPISLDEDFISRLPKSLRDNPGFNNFWLNLNSDIFSQPYGLVLFMKDNNMSDVAAVFLEECYVQNHGLQISANSVVMAESSVVRFERIVPIKVKVDTYGSTGASYRGTGSIITGAINDVTNFLSNPLGGLGL